METCTFIDNENNYSRRMLMHRNFKVPKLTRVMAHKQPIYGLCALDDHSLFVSGANDKQIKVWQGTDTIFSQGFESEIRAICSNSRFLHTGVARAPISEMMIAISLKTQKTLFFEYESRSIQWSFETAGVVWSSMFIGLDTFLCGDTAGFVYIIDWKKKLVNKTQAHIESIRTLAFHPVTQNIILGSQDGAISTMEIHTKAVTHSRKLPQGILQLTYSPTTKTIYGSFGEGQIIELTEDLRVLYQWQSHFSKIRAMIAHPTQNLLITGGDQGIIRIWALEQKENIESLKLGKYEIWNLILLNDHTLIACDYSGDIFIIEF